MTKDQAIQFRKEMVDIFTEQGIDCSWLMESGGVVAKRNGEVKVSFSLRNQQTFKSDVVKMKELVGQKVDDVKISVSNQFSSFRPEGRLIVTFNR